ncbi:MAG: succinate dehydrogenase iron-sulfur subunit [Nitrospirae bacterium]|nr:MAG: succinate dehydrogenase iron-sulfur subunit [Nitrospirota bacterium]
MERTITVRLARYSPERPEEGQSFATYEVPMRPKWMVLDALNYIKNELDPTVTFRYSCRMAVCGSCGMLLNGEPKLACNTFLDDYHGTLTVEPLSNFPVLRDLVIDMEGFMEKLSAIRPWVVREDVDDPTGGEYRQSPEELELYRQFSQCINCMLCYAACPVYGHDPDFLGPAATALGYRYQHDNRDQGNAERQPVLTAETGVWNCSFVGECSKVCPKGVEPAAAIQRTKLNFVMAKLLEFVLPWRRP